MEPTRNRRRWTTGAIVIGSLIGSGAVASAVTSPSSSSPVPVVTEEQSNTATPSTATGAPTTEANEHHGAADRTAHEAQEANDGTDAKLLAQAKVTPDQAKAVALAITPVTAASPDIHDRDGALSYTVRITTPPGEVEMTVDATTGAATLDNEGPEHHGGQGPESNDDWNRSQPSTPTATTAA